MAAIRILAGLLVGALSVCGLAQECRAQCNQQVLTGSVGHGNDFFGKAVAIDGDTMVGSMIGFSGGAVIAFQRTGSVWSETQVITAPNPGLDHGFGLSLALDSGTLMIREHRQDWTLFPEGGSVVHVYSRQGTQWVWHQKLEAPVPGAPTLTHFGQKLDIDGDTAYVSDTWRRLIHVFEKSGGTWVEVAPITPADLQPLPAPNNGHFPGNIVADGDRLLVATNPAVPSQLVYVLERDANGWHGEALLTAPVQTNNPRIAMIGDTVFVGSELEAGQAGRVYVFEKQAGQWNRTSITPDPWYTFARFGESLDANERTLVVGSPGWSLPVTDTGRAYLYEHDGSAWREVAVLDSAQPLPSVPVAVDVAVSEDSLVAGAPSSTSSPEPGRVHTWDLVSTLGVPYGDSKHNSSGLAANLSALGNAFIDANCLTLEMTSLPAGQFGYVLMSLTQGFVPLFGGSQGNLHLALPIVRFSGDVLLSDSSGEASFAPDLAALPQGSVFLPGETWNFQMWFRDVNPGPTSNTTNGLAVTFATTGDPAVQFPSTLLEVEEALLQLPVSITLSQAAEHDVTIPFTAGGSAEYNVDWRVEEANPIVIPAGETSFEMTIIVAEDGNPEADETATVTLGSPTGGVLGTAATFTLTIVNDD